MVCTGNGATPPPRKGSFSGTYTLYARADFTDQSALTWGPRTAVCEGPGLIYPWTWTE